MAVAGRGTDLNLRVALDIAGHDARHQQTARGRRSEEGRYVVMYMGWNLTGVPRYYTLLNA